MTDWVKWAGKTAAAALLFSSATAAWADAVRKDILPADTDGGIVANSGPHIVFSSERGGRAPLLVFLPGTGGETTRTVVGEQAFIDTALAQGYRFIILSYIDTPAVSQVCTRPVLATNPDCAAQLRQKRAFGENTTALIQDKPKDAIVHRLTALLRYLAKTDPQGRWEQYLDQQAVDWSKVVLSGQSQGGGMAAYIAKRVAVRGVIDFSGGWDMRANNRIASWYSSPGVTPPDRLFGTYHVQENFASAIHLSYNAMRIPADHQFALNKPIRRPNADNPGHGEGASNPVYRELWQEMLEQLKRGE